MTAATTGWISFGVDYGANGMDKADTYVAYYDTATSKVVVLDCWVNGLSTTLVDTNLGGKNNILQSIGSYQNGVLNIKFKRTLTLTTANDAYDKPIPTDVATKVTVAYSNTMPYTSQHCAGCFKKVSITFAAGVGAGGGANGTKSGNSTSTGGQNIDIGGDSANDVIFPNIVRFSIFPYHLVVTGAVLALVVVVAFLVTVPRFFACSGLRVTMFGSLFIQRHWLCDPFAWLVPSFLAAFKSSSSSVLSFLGTFYFETIGYDIQSMLFDVSLGQAILSILHVIVGLIWFAHSLHTSINMGRTTFPSIGRALGVWTLFNLGATLLPIARWSLFTVVFGASRERRLSFHRWIASFTFFIMSLHFLFLLIYYTLPDGPGIASFVTWDAASTINNLPGLLAWIFFTMLMISSLPFVRRQWFELFYINHYLWAILGFVFTGLHVQGYYMLVAIGLGLAFLLVDYTLRLITSVNCKLLKCEENGDISMLELEIPTRFRYKAGQYIMLYVGNVAYFQAHPFSIANGEYYTNEEGKRAIKLYIKDVGLLTFTNALRNWIQQLKKAKDFDLVSKGLIRIEGPYGNHSVSCDQYKTVVLFAGGIGITPLVSMLSTYAAKMADGAEKPTKNLKTIHFIWSVREAATLKFFEKQISDAMAQAKGNVKVMVHLTGRGNGDAQWQVPINTNRVDPNAALEEIAKDPSSEDSKYIGVYTCGPHELVHNVQYACWKNSSFSGKQFQFHKETFLF